MGEGWGDDVTAVLSVDIKSVAGRLLIVQEKRGAVLTSSTPGNMRELPVIFPLSQYPVSILAPAECDNLQHSALDRPVHHNITFD